jgi:hypothetical protein
MVKPGCFRRGSDSAHATGLACLTMGIILFADAG